MDLYAASLKLHAENRGKLETVTRIPVNTRDDLSLAYSPGVAEPCRAIAKDPTLADTLTLKGRTVAVISDGSAVLGLGNIGPLASLPVMEGKCVLFKEFAGVDAFPVILGTQDTEEIIAAVKAIAPTFGGINLEDISAPRCFEIEERLKAELDIPVMHDDQHGTAFVALAGLYNAMKVTGRKIGDVKVVVNGPGAAGTATIKLFRLAGVRNVIACDSKGTLSSKRTDLDGAKAKLLEITNPDDFSGTMKEALVGADVFVGLSQPGLLDRHDVAKMAKDPIVFAMANPTPEIMPDEAKAGGAAIVATGRSDFPNQINNVLAFPGIFRGVLDSGKKKITDEMKLAVARALADYVENPTTDRIIPDPLDKNVAKAVAEAIKRS